MCNRECRPKCEVCGSNNMQLIQIPLLSKEPHEIFDYWRCAKCKSIQIDKIPENLSDYYAWVQAEDEKSWKNWLWNKAKEYDMTGKSLIGAICHKIYGFDDYSFIQRIKNCSEPVNILDVGCGRNGCLQMIKKNYEDKVLHLDGIDLHISGDSEKDGIKLTKADIFSFEPSYKYDIVMLNHVFEHLENPQKVLLELKKFLKPDGILSISMPITSEYMWKKLGIYAQIDLSVPVHFHIYSKDGMVELLESCGWHVNSYTCTFSPTQNVYAEYYKNGNPVTTWKLIKEILQIKKRKKIESEGNGDIGRFICTIEKQ